MAKGKRANPTAGIQRRSKVFAEAVSRQRRPDEVVPIKSHDVANLIGEGFRQRVPFPNIH
jgi:hypothetical protein